MNPVDLNLIQQANNIAAETYSAAKIIPLLDLTSLNESDDQQTILDLCRKAKTKLGSVAAVCIYPQFIEIAKQQLNLSTIKICTVANFPHGDQSLETILESISTSIQQGADEVDVVIPYSAYLQGEKNIITPFIAACKNACKDKTLKVILETGIIKDLDLIYSLSCEVIKGGADFIKTSTGKVAINATLEAADAMLNAIKVTNKNVGFKAAGAIRTYQQASSYLFLAEQVMGVDWLCAQHFRLGASSLLNDLLKF